MTSCAITMGLLGLTLTFFPEEALRLLNFETSEPITLIFQLLGALYFAFAMVNWYARMGVIGGIYNKPIALGNFAHFLIGALALTKAVFASPELPTILIMLSGIYLVFAITFAVIHFSHPLKE
jgi:hypothetical protein